jgi:hypothetical protein
VKSERLLTNDEMRALLVSAIARAGGVNAFARAHGIKQPNVSAMKNGRIPVGGMVARALGLDRVAGWAKKIGCTGGGIGHDIRQAGIGARRQRCAQPLPAVTPPNRTPRASLARASRRSP